ncbi:hydrolase [Leptospira ognonensis]|uniref:Hydrolase n=1 Tax=Leptospira ognonensis TaxID=2484945 RepID=A0A4R9JUZ9_9LEPT|nr:amidohydrolase family protein [Leptospira ognonensis]TGL56659.1 hydrolase [Leptospira ognonensis]
MSLITYTNAVLFESGEPKQVDLLIQDSLVKDITPNAALVKNVDPSNKLSYDLRGKIVYPGFINSHDHLLASYLPKIGGATKHNSWLAYDNLYKSSGVFAERQQIEIELLHYLGAYKNLLGAVTSVQDHIPHNIHKPFLDSLPVKLIHNYYLSHSLGNYSLGWGEGPALEYKLAAQANLPFITHLGEGLDEDSINSLKKLEKAEALGEFSVLIHCLPFGPREVEKIAKAGASVVWCPTSNLHIFGKTTNIKLFMDMGVNVCLGTDFSPSGSSNLLEELRFAKKLFFDLYEEEISDRTLLDWITVNPSKAFKIPNIGSLKAGCSADFVVFEEDEKSSEISISNKSSGQIDLIVIDGSPRLASIHHKKLFSDLGIDFEIIKLEGKDKIVAGSPLSLLKQVSASVGYKKELAFLPIF